MGNHNCNDNLLAMTSTDRQKLDLYSKLVIFPKTVWREPDFADTSGFDVTERPGEENESVSEKPGSKKPKLSKRQGRMKRKQALLEKLQNSAAPALDDQEMQEEPDAKRLKSEALEDDSVNVT